MIKDLFIVSLLAGIFVSGSIHAQEPGPLIVHFRFDSFQLSAAAKVAIDSFSRAVARWEDTATSSRDMVEISGYTDSIGSSGYNENLSVRRALAVKAYLVAKGLAEGRIRAAGYGKRYPLAGNGSDSERAVNRRVEIIFRRGGTDGIAGMPPVQQDSIVVPEQKENTVVSAPPKRTIYDVVMDSTVAVGSAIPLRDVNFFSGRHIPLPVCNLILDELARAMKANPRLRIHIEGHICCLPDGIDGVDLGTGRPNLSVERAKYVYDYLVRLGIAKKRMSYVGFGASGKLYPLEENEVERAENRRVEIRILAR